MYQPRVDLLHTKAHGGGDAKEGAHQGEDIHHITDRSIDTLLQYGVQAAADAQRQFVAEREVSQDETCQGKDRPCVDTPVEEGGQLCVLGFVDNRGQGRIDIVRHRLRHAKIHQADTHAGGEEHGDPGEEAILRL